VVAVAWTRIATVTIGSGRLVNAEGVYTGLITIWYSPDSSAVVRTLKVPFTALFLKGYSLPGLPGLSAAAVRWLAPFCAPSHGHRHGLGGSFAHCWGVARAAARWICRTSTPASTWEAARSCHKPGW
jgi:hypothetical protein